MSVMNCIVRWMFYFVLHTHTHTEWFTVRRYSQIPVHLKMSLVSSFVGWLIAWLFTYFLY